MTTSQEIRPVEPMENIVSPGSQLRRARESRRLSIDAVAAELHVLPKIISAIESDDFEQLPSAVYVRGYLRNYARVVRISPDPLVETYNRIIGVEAVPVAPQIQNEVNEDRQLRWGMYLSGLGVLVLLVIWASSGRGLRFWEARQPEPALDSSAVQPYQDTLPSRATPSMPASVTMQPTSKPASSPAVPPPAVQSATVEPPSTGEAASLPTLAPSTRLPAMESSPQARALATAPPVPSPSVVPDAGQAGLDTLTVRLNADSWVSIHDAAGERLVYGALTAGTVRSVSGHAPFSVVIGNSPAVQMEFNGQPFDHSKYNKGAVARFKITR